MTFLNGIVIGDSNDKLKHLDHNDSIASSGQYILITTVGHSTKHPGHTTARSPSSQTMASLNHTVPQKFTLRPNHTSVMTKLMKQASHKHAG